MGKNKIKLNIFIILVLVIFCLGFFIDSAKAADIEASASRTSGVAPLSVHFNADLTASSETERSFHDLEYAWNFGDTNAGNWGTNGKPKNEDKGPVAAHVYEAPGTFTATLTVRDATGIIDAKTFEITVEDPDVVFAGTNTICISDATSNDFTACPAGAQNIATDSLVDVSTLVVSGKRVLFRRGSEWSTAVALIGNNNIIQANVGAYGTCIDPDANGICANAPEITLTNTSESLFSFYEKNDFVIQDLSLVSVKAESSTGVTGGGRNISKCTFLRNKVRGFDSAISWFHGQRTAEDQRYPIDMSVVACDARDFNGYAFFGGGENLSVMGNQFHNSDTTHITRVWWAYKGVYSHNMVSGSSLTNTQARADLKFHGPKSSDDQPWGVYKPKEVGTFEETGAGGLPYSTKYAVIADNVFGSSGSRPVDILPQNTYADERIYDVIFERNKMIQDYGNHSSVPWLKAFHILGYYITARNNIFDASYEDGDLHGLTQIEIENYGFMPTPTGTHIYNNTFYGKGDTMGNGVTGVRVFAGVTGAVIRNNYLSYPDATSSKTIIEDNSGIAVTSNNIMTDTPYFADPDNLNPLLRDFTLTSNSIEAIDQGITVPVFEDFTGQSRVGVYDIGAYEYAENISFRADVDGSLEITTTDALLTLRNSLGLSMNGTAWRASATTGDVNCDGVSNSTDALLILRYSLGLGMGETGWCE